MWQTLPQLSALAAVFALLEKSVNRWAWISSAMIGFVKCQPSYRMSVKSRGGGLLWEVGDHDLLCTAALAHHRAPPSLHLSLVATLIKSPLLRPWLLPPSRDPLHLKFPHLCKSLCRLMQHFMQIPFFATQAWSTKRQMSADPSHERSRGPLPIIT